MNAWIQTPLATETLNGRFQPPRLPSNFGAWSRYQTLDDPTPPPAQAMSLPGVTARERQGNRKDWRMGVSLCEAPEGYDSANPASASSGHVIEWHLNPVRVSRVLSSGQVMETLPPGGFLLRPSGIPLGLVASGPARFAQFFTSDDFVRTVASDWLGEAGERADLFAGDRIMRSDPSIAPMLDLYLRRAFDEEEPPTRLEMDSRAYLIVLQVLKRHSRLADKSSRARRGGLAPFQLKRVCERMTQDLSEEVPLVELAAMAGVSYHHFCHAFKASTGVAPHQWLVERRVEAACDLLRSTRLSVTEIAASVGYDDPNQLLRVFRSRRGTTPVAYRREFQQSLMQDASAS